MHENKNFLLQIPSDLIEKIESNLKIKHIENKFYMEIPTSMYNNREEGMIQLGGEQFDLKNVYYCEIENEKISLLPINSSANLILNDEKITFENFSVENSTIKNSPYKINFSKMAQTTKKEPIDSFIFKKIIFNDEEILNYFSESEELKKVIFEMTDVFFNRRVLKTKYYKKIYQEKRVMFLQNTPSDILTRNEFENLTVDIPFSDINFVNELFYLKNEYFYLKSSPKIFFLEEGKKVLSEMENVILRLFKTNEFLRKKDVQNQFKKWGKFENEEYKRAMEKLAVAHGNYWVLKK